MGWHPKNDEEQPDHAIPDLGQAGRGEHREEHRPERRTAIHPDDQSNASEVDQAEGQTRREERHANVPEHFAGAGDGREVPWPAQDQIDDSADRTEDGTECGVEDPGGPPDRATLDQDGEHQHDSAAYRPNQHARSQGHNAAGCDSHALDHSDAHQPGDERENSEDRKGDIVVRRAVIEPPGDGERHRSDEGERDDSVHPAIADVSADRRLPSHGPTLAGATEAGAATGIATVARTRPRSRAMAVRPNRVGKEEATYAWGVPR